MRESWELVRVREMVPGDRAWVISSWIESYSEHGTGLVTHIPRGEYCRRWRNVIEACLETSTTLVVCPLDDDDTILAWLCAIGKTVHYAHVKRTFHGLGFLSLLLRHAGISRTTPGVRYSHKTNVVDRLKAPESWSYEPWLVIGLR